MKTFGLRSLQHFTFQTHLLCVRSRLPPDYLVWVSSAASAPQKWGLHLCESVAAGVSCVLGWKSSLLPGVCLLVWPLWVDWFRQMILAHFVKWLICVEVSVSAVHVGQNLQAAICRYRRSQKRSVRPWNTDYALRKSKQTFSCALMDPHSSLTGTWLQYGAAAELSYRLTNRTVQ